MIGWSKILRQSPIDWLLEKSNPSVRYFVLRDILDKPEDDLEVLAAKRSIPESKCPKDSAKTKPRRILGEAR